MNSTASLAPSVKHKPQPTGSFDPLSQSSVRSPRLPQPRDTLVEASLPLVRTIAEKLHRQLPYHVDLDSLLQAGAIGLLNATERYDPTQGVPFAAYARHRIQGEILEYLRSCDWVSRSVRTWSRRVEAARARLRVLFGREASAEEMATELGLSLDQYYHLESQVSAASLLSLAEVAEELLPDTKPGPVASLEQKEMAEKVTSEIQKLSHRERLVVVLAYYRELRFTRIGELLGVTQERISQIHAQALSHLRQALSVEPFLSGGMH